MKSSIADQDEMTKAALEYVQVSANKEELDRRCEVQKEEVGRAQEAWTTGKRSLRSFFEDLRSHVERPSPPSIYCREATVGGQAPDQQSQACFG